LGLFPPQSSIKVQQVSPVLERRPFYLAQANNSNTKTR
jgi:hypothetical protein